MTAGLPNLTVVCDVQGFDFSNGTVDFGDGKPAREFRSAEKKPDDAEPDEDKDAVPPFRFFHRYQNQGAYRVNLVVTGESGSNNAWQMVTVLRHGRVRKPSPPYRLNPITVDNLEITENTGKLVERTKKFQVAQRLSKHGIFMDSRKSYTLNLKPDGGWKFEENSCAFQKTSQQFADYNKSKIPMKEKSGEFRFALESSSFLRGFEDGWLYGVIECTQWRTVGEEIKTESGQFTIHRYGIHEVDLKKTETPIRFGKDSKITWHIKAKNLKDGYRNLGSDVEIEGAAVSLVDIPIIPLEERPLKVYLRVEPKNL